VSEFTAGCKRFDRKWLKPRKASRRAVPHCSDIEIIRCNADSLLVNVTATGMAFADWLDSIGIKATRVRVMRHGIERA